MKQTMTAIGAAALVVVLMDAAASTDSVTGIDWAPEVITVDCHWCCEITIKCHT